MYLCKHIVLRPISNNQQVTKRTFFDFLQPKNSRSSPSSSTQSTKTDIWIYRHSSETQLPVSPLPKLESGMEPLAREENINTGLTDTKTVGATRACDNSEIASAVSTDIENSGALPENASSPMTNSGYTYRSDGTVTAYHPRYEVPEIPTAYSSYWSPMMAWRNWHHCRGQAILAGRDVSSWKPPDLTTESNENYGHCQYNMRGAYTWPYEAGIDLRNYSMYENCMGPPKTETGGTNDINLDQELEKTRNTLTLHSILSYVRRERLDNALQGKTLDIVEEQTGNRLAQNVPKKMLILFCGRKTISRFLRTLVREDNENWAGLPVKQELLVPQGKANSVGLTILISWMQQACSRKSRGPITPIHIPHNLFAAISLVRVMNLFSLDADAARVDMKVRHVHFARPLSIDDIRSVWKGYPKDSKYVNRLVIEIRSRLILHPDRRRQMLRGVEEIEAYLDEVPALFARVYCQRNNVHVQQFAKTDRSEDAHLA